MLENPESPVRPERAQRVPDAPARPAPADDEPHQGFVRLLLRQPVRRALFPADNNVPAVTRPQPPFLGGLFFQVDREVFMAARASQENDGSDAYKTPTTKRS